MAYLVRLHCPSYLCKLFENNSKLISY